MFCTKFNNKYVNKLPIATPIAVADYLAILEHQKKFWEDSMEELKK